MSNIPRGLSIATARRLGYSFRAPIIPQHSTYIGSFFPRSTKPPVYGWKVITVPTLNRIFNDV